MGYTLHHIGIPTTEMRAGERHAAAAAAGMFTTDDLSGPLPIQWHRFTTDSPLHPLLKSQPHIAYRADDLQAAIAGHRVLLGPYEPIDDFRVAVVDNAGMPVELIETSLADEEIWHRARSGRRSVLYMRDAERSDPAQEGACSS